MANHSSKLKKILIPCIIATVVLAIAIPLCVYFFGSNGYNSRPALDNWKAFSEYGDLF